MTSAFIDKYSKAQSLLPKLSPLLISINDEIKNLVSADSNDEIAKTAKRLDQNFLEAHSINDDYSEVFASIERAIGTMDEEEQKIQEQKTLKDTMRSTDGSTKMDIDPVSVASIISKLENKYARSLQSVSVRVRTVSYPSTSIDQSASIASSTGQSTSPSIYASASSLASPDNTSSPNNDSIAALTDRINSLESTRTSVHQPNIALPPIKLETFDGADITRWPAFKYQLDMLILNQPHLNEVEKAFYVRSSLKGTAYNLVATIPTQKDFLAKIIERLEQEYNRVHLTNAALMKALRSIRSKSSKLDDQLTAVRSLINIVHTIDADCGINGLCTQAQIAERIHTRFVPFVWRQKADTLLAALKLIEDTLRTELEDVTMIDAFSDRSLPRENPDSSFHNPRPKSNKSPPSTTSNPNQSAKSPKDVKCVFCGLHDYSGSCTAVTSPKDRKEILRKKSLCHCCFSSSHSTADCKKKCQSCSGKHHRSLCEKPSTYSANTGTVSEQQPERLYTVSAIVSNPDSNANVSARNATIHLDHGSQVSLISRKLVNELSLVPFDRREMTISGINGEHSAPSPYDIVTVEIHTDRGRVPIAAVVREVSSVNTIHTQSLSNDDLSVIQSTLGCVPDSFSKSSVVHTDILLSVGDTLDLLENSKDTKLPCGYRLVQSTLGPLVVGSNKPRSRSIDPVVSVLTTHNDESFEQKIERMFSVDPAARVYETTEKEARKAANELVNKHFDETIQKQGDEYFVQYSVKPEARTDLPSNYDLATSRLSSTLKTLSKERANLEYYDNVISDQLSLGQIEKVDPSDNEGIIHYLAHQPVLRPDKPSTPLRIVYDASAHLKNSPSLNDMIHPGPSDLERIPALLLRSRSRKGLIVADVEKAFLQVKLHPSQRNMLRFLWVKDLDKPVTRQNILVLRFCVTPFGVNASPSLLNKVIHHHIQLNGGECDPNLVHQLITNLYVDNVIINVDSALSNMYHQSKQLFDTMSMNLRDFASNDPLFNSLVNESDRSKDEVQKLLGLLWNTKTDKLSIRIPISSKDGKMSKRTMLSAASSPYDPLGWLNPLTLPPRLTIQNLWNTTLKWDQPVDDTTRETFHKQMEDLERFNLSIDRYSHLSRSAEITLVAFSDASKLAMGACVYSWSPDITPTLLISKTRLAPIKCKSTIPKMELDSLVMAHSLIQFTVETLRKEFPDKPIHVYTYSDSAVVLHWCRPEFSKPLGVFVTNRVKKIHEIREELSAFKPVFYHHPRHVRSEYNPADHATRGLTAQSMNDPKHQWWVGPEWMQSHSSDSWPNEDLSSLQCPSIDSFPMVACALTKEPPPCETVIDLTRFSSLSKAISVTARVYRFLTRCASRVKNPSIVEKLKHLPDSSAPNLSSAEKRFACNSIIRLHQARYITVTDPLVKKNLIVQDGKFWKSNSRITHSNLQVETKSPIFIPTSDDSTLAKLILSDIHHSSSHSSLDVILNQAKHRYWIPRCRQIAKSVLKQCVPCRKTNNLPFRYPSSPALPHDRVRQSRPFEHCGIDYAGPFHSNSDQKMYVVVFTCFSTRLTHLEVVDSLLPSSFAFAFRRFCSRRGTPSQITSDKATTFKMASTLFVPPEADPNVNTLISNMGINWNFTTAHSPWKGGIYERLVKIIKDSLSRSIGRKKLSYDEFNTIICDIEALLNSRPLTYVASDDVQSFNGPVLRPIDLISPDSFLGCSIILSDSDGDYIPPDEENRSREAAIRQLKRSIQTVDTFWKRWHAEYLTTLRDCSSKSDPLHSTRSTTHLPSRGSLVLVVDESGVTPRSSWKMAKVLSLTENSATLRSHAGRIIERPINLLIPLEIHSTEETTNAIVAPTLVVDPHANNHPMLTRSKKSNSRN